MHLITRFLTLAEVKNLPDAEKFQEVIASVNTHLDKGIKAEQFIFILTGDNLRFRIISSTLNK